MVSKPPESWWLPSLSPHSWATLTWTVHLTWAKLNAWFPVSKSSVVPLFLISVNGTTVYPGGQTKSLWKQKSGHATAKPSMGFLSFLEKKEKKSRLFPRCHTSPSSFLLTPFHPHGSPCSSDSGTSYTSGPLHLLCLPKIFYPQDIHLVHSLNTLLKCYLLKRGLFWPVLYHLYVFISKCLYMRIIYT